ncbi:MAG: hypothetical protein QM500_09565 [Methylococcales bacterium]
MCSSPKGSSQCFRHSKKKEFSRADYDEYASMVERASAVYDRIEREKAEKRELLAKENPIKIIKDKPVFEADAPVGVLGSIKAFLLQPVFRKNMT